MGERAAYEVWAGESLVGELRDVRVDQPWFRGRFVPGAAWDEFGALFAAQEEARREGYPDHLVGALGAVKDLGVELRSVRGGETIRPLMIHLCEGKGSFRY